MKPITRPLCGCIVGISVSESGQSADRGFPSWLVNRTTIQLSSALLGQGAAVAFGHDWRDDGVMEAVQHFARQMQPAMPASPVAPEAEAPTLLRNLLPWPDQPHLSEADLACLAGTLKVDSAGLPEALLSFAAEAQATGAGPVYSYLRARGLTHLRRKLTEACCARICLGGRTNGSSGRYPGIIEEGLLAVQAQAPLYLAGLLGGATQQLIAALEGKSMPEEFCQPGAATQLYMQPPVRETNPATAVDRRVDPAGVWRIFQETGVDGLSHKNFLTVAENRELFRTPSLERVIDLVLKGLAALHRNRPPKESSNAS